MEKDKLGWALIIGAVVLLFFLLSGLFSGGSGMMGGGMMGSGGMLGGLGFGFILMLLFWGALIWIVITIIRGVQPDKKELHSISTLKKRFAQGEITKKQFQAMKKELLR